ncbi:MAG: hypothetical protein JW785_11865 [Acidimicrobiia bacterium]|nr:hypothetical protein [Acidimicrobiia bacterium]
MQPLWRAVFLGLILAAAWAVPAFLTDNVYHPAPLLVGAVIPLGVALGPRVPAMPLRLAATAAGAILALATTGLLGATGHLDGPSLLRTRQRPGRGCGLLPGRGGHRPGARPGPAAVG